MEKRVFLAIFLSFVVLVIYQTQFAPAPPPAAQTASGTTAGSVAPQTTGQPSAPATTPGQTAAPAAATSTGGASASTPDGRGAQPPAAPSAKVIRGDTIARDIVVETDAVTATFNTQGGALKSWRLHRYHDAAGAPLDLIPADV